MDDISAQLNKILSDPQSMAQIQTIMNGLGVTTGDNQSQTTSQNNAQTNQQSDSNLDMMSIMTKVAPLLSTIKQDDNSAKLLSALKPMLSEKRQEKITQAIRILQLMKLMPLLKDSGILSSVLGGLF